MIAALIADDGNVVTGQNHGDCFSKLSANEKEHDICSGFLDEEHGRFISEDNCEFYLKQIIFIRHAECNSEGLLTDQGKKHAVQTASFLSSINLRNFQFFSSPRQRCVETSTILARTLPMNFVINYNLEEQIASEMLSDFLHRVHEVLDWLPTHSLIVSHCDFIHVATDMASGESVKFPSCIPNCSLTFIDNHRLKLIAWTIPGN